MRTWFCGKFINVEIGQRFFVGHSGSGRCKVFGELATLERATAKHLVFKTDSGAAIKTKIDNLHEVIGKAGAQGNFVSPIIDRDYIHSALYVW